MESPPNELVERIQRLAATTVATHPAGYKLHLIGGLRYRLLSASVRTSVDIDYHWEGDLQQKQREIGDLLHSKLLPEVKRLTGYEGDVRLGAGTEGESPAVRTVETAFYRVAEAGSRIEIPIEITRIARLDAPEVRTIAGTVFLTVSDADMIESKIIALLTAPICRVRDVVDLFLFQRALLPDASLRLSQKFAGLSLRPADAVRRLDRLEANRVVHVRETERILEEQVAPAVTANLREAGGGAMIWDSVVRLLRDVFAKVEEMP